MSDWPALIADLSSVSGTLGIANGGTNITSFTQGDLLYASSSSILSKLVKDVNATRYLSNTGSSNNPAWAQVNVANGITGTVPIANGGTGAITLAAANIAVTSGKLSQFASTTSAELLGVISNATGTGALVFASTPTLVTPVLGAATCTSIQFNIIGSLSVGTITKRTSEGLAIVAVTGAALDFNLLAANLNSIIAVPTGTDYLQFYSRIGFFNATPAAQQTSAANLTNSVTSGGTDNTITDFSDLTTYSNSAAAIRNDIYQLARKLKQVNDSLRTYGLLT